MDKDLFDFFCFNTILEDFENALFMISSIEIMGISLYIYTSPTMPNLAFGSFLPSRLTIPGGSIFLLQLIATED